MSDTITEIGQEQLKSAFNTEVENLARTYRQQIEPQLDQLSQEALPYRKGTAGLIYGKRPWTEAIKKYEDGFGFYKATINMLKDISSGLHPDDVRAILSKLDELGKPFGVRISTAKPGDRPNILTYEVDRQKLELCHPLLVKANALHTDYAAPEHGRIRGTEFEIAHKTPDYKCYLLVNETTIDRVPFAALLSGMHEAGHADEILNGIVSNYEVGRHQTRQGVACTEYTFTRLATKLAQVEYVRSGRNKDIIRYAAPQVALYNRVVNG